MPIDGIFVHHLVKELAPKITYARINKIHQPNALDIVLFLRIKAQTLQLLISSSLDASRMYLTNNDYNFPDQPFNFCMILRKYLERGLITNIEQFDNDRVIKLTISAFNEMGDNDNFFLIIELIGRNANIILTKSDYTIIDAIRKLTPNEQNDRIIIAKAKYSLPQKQGNINPFSEISDFEKLQKLNLLEGCSKLVINEFIHLNSVDKVLNNETYPVLYGKYFYCLPISHLNIEAYSYNTLSELLDSFYRKETNTHSGDFIPIKKFLQKEINKLKSKKNNFESELEKAKERLCYQKYGVLIKTYLYDIPNNCSSYNAYDYDTNTMITINLDPLLSPIKNMEKCFSIHKKALSALSHLKVQIELVDHEIIYLSSILDQLDYVNKDDLLEIKQELIQGNYLKQKRKNTTKKSKLKLLQYNLPDAQIWVGKNNIQNDYLSHKLAHHDDYWFHVKNIPGSHVILRCNELNEDLIRTCSNLACLYSKARTSSSVPVDYTKVKCLHKIPGIKGYHVTYTNQLTIYIDPDEELLNKIAIYQCK